MKVKVFYTDTNYNVSVQYRKGRSGYLILLIHGLGSSKKVFKNLFQKQEFSDYSLLAIDLLGHGESDKPQAFSYTIQDHARILFQVLAQFSFTELIVVGHSLGAAIGLFLIQDRDTNLFISIEGAIYNDDTGERLPFDSFRQQFTIKNTYPFAFIQTGASLSNQLNSDTLLTMFMHYNQRKVHLYGSYINPSFLKLLKPSEVIKINTKNKGGHFAVINNPHCYEALLSIITRKQTS